MACIKDIIRLGWMLWRDLWD